MEPFLVGMSVLLASAQAPVVPPRAARTRRPTEEAEKAVLEGLRWLARHQNPDGSWSPVTSRERCTSGTSCFDPALEETHHYDGGVTALALLAFLDAGFTQKTIPDSDHPFDEVVGKGLRWLQEQQKPDGSFTAERPFLYNEALATTALSDALRIGRDPSLREPAQKGVDFLQAAQSSDSEGKGKWGWRYGPQGSTGDINLSVTAACLLALSRAGDADLRVEPSSIDGARRFCKFVTANDGLVGYRDPKEAGAMVTGPFDDRFKYHYTAMTALGMCIRLGSSPDLEDFVLDLSAKRLVGDLPRASEDRSSIDYSYWYHATLALGTIDSESSPRRTGKYWNPWKKACFEALLSLQSKERTDCAKGGWLVSDRWSSYSGVGAIYDTAMSVRTLEIPLTSTARISQHPLAGGLAPEIRLPDERGSELWLANVSKKVVLLDFLDSGDPQFEFDLAARKSLAQRLAGKPFALFSVVVSPTGVDRFPPSSEREDLSWYCMRVTTAKDRVLEDYRVRKLPTLVVVDRSGVIRGGGKPWDETIQMVEFLVLLAERNAKPK